VPEFLAQAEYLRDQLRPGSDECGFCSGRRRGSHSPQGAGRASAQGRAGVHFWIPCCWWRGSLLDLALAWDRPLSFDILGQIAEALSESDLPYKVDIVDLATTEPAFRERRIPAGRTVDSNVNRPDAERYGSPFPNK
jgi:hypothetical protein